MKIKKLLLFSLFLLFFPFLIVLVFKQGNIEKEKFNYKENQIVRVYREKSNIIENIPLEEYIIGVVATEVPLSFDSEALKAQAVASRTYVMYEKKNNGNKSFDVYDSVNSQAFSSLQELKNKWGSDFEKQFKKVKKVVEETSGQILTYNGDPILSFFFSTSSGITENSDEVFSQSLPYLKSTESKWDLNAPKYESEINFSKQDFCHKLDIDCSANLNIEILEKTSANNIKKIKINLKEFKGTEVRKLLNLRSTNFQIKQGDELITVITKGYGHDVGMSQYGAQGMANEGYSYEQILKYYYKDVDIQKI